jgi:hypothetical protein
VSEQILAQPCFRRERYIKGNSCSVGTDIYCQLLSLTLVPFAVASKAGR